MKNNYPIMYIYKDNIIVGNVDLAYLFWLTRDSHLSKDCQHNIFQLKKVSASFCA